MDKYPLGHLLLSQSCAHFSDFRCLPSPLLINAGHKLVQLQSSTWFSLHFSQATLNEAGKEGRGLQKNPEYVIKSELKDKTLNCLQEFVHDCNNISVDHSVSTAQ